MPVKKKILFVANYPDQPTGYARIAYRLSNFLASLPGMEVYYFGFNNYPERRIKRGIHPDIHFIDVIQESNRIGSNDIYGKSIIVSVMNDIRPDILFIYNDIVVICNLFNSLLKIKNTIKYRTIVYLDLVYQYEKPEYIRHVDNNSDMIIVFSDCWRRHLIQMSVDPSKIDVIYHGLDEGHFYPIDVSDARHVFGFSENDFIILNTNNNSYRKAHDISIRAFLQFLKKQGCPTHIKLFINCCMKTNAGYDILSLIEVECIRLGLSLTNIINNNIITMSTPGYIDDTTMNYLYNACDIGINTALGEGFGLCNLEHGSVGKPQVVSAVGALADIFSDEIAILIKPVCTLAVSNHTDDHGGLLEICRSEDFADALETYFLDKNRRITTGEKCRQHILETYNWENILKKFGNIIKKIADV